MNDINLDVLFEPFPLFPILGAFCNGIMCRLGIPIHYSFVSFVLNNISKFIIEGAICFHRRKYRRIRSHLFSLSTSEHSERSFPNEQSAYILQIFTPFRYIFQKTFNIIRFCIIFVYTMPGIVSFCVEFDGSQTEYLIDNVGK